MAITEKEGTETTVKLGVYIIHGGSSCRRIYGVWSTIVHRVVKGVKSAIVRVRCYMHP